MLETISFLYNQFLSNSFIPDVKHWKICWIKQFKYNFIVEFIFTKYELFQGKLNFQFMQVSVHIVQHRNLLLIFYVTLFSFLRSYCIAMMRVEWMERLLNRLEHWKKLPFTFSLRSSVLSNSSHSMICTHCPRWDIHFMVVEIHFQLLVLWEAYIL